MCLVLRGLKVLPPIATDWCQKGKKGLFARKTRRDLSSPGPRLFFFFQGGLGRGLLWVKASVAWFVQKDDLSREDLGVSLLSRSFDSFSGGLIQRHHCSHLLGFLSKPKKREPSIF